MSERMPFGAATLVIPFSFVQVQERRQGGGTSRMVPAADRYRQGVVPATGGSGSIAPVPRVVATNQDQSEPEKLAAEGMRADQKLR